MDARIFRGREADMNSARRLRSLPSRESTKARLVELIDSREIRFGTPLSERALAEQMGISESSARSMVHRGVSKLRGDDLAWIQEGSDVH
jgi:DNA-binding FadR family transcriptional regulator